VASLFTQQARKDLIAIYGRDSEIVIAFRDAILAQRKPELAIGLEPSISGSPSAVSGSTDEIRFTGC
jgi:hypothetical protein